MLKSPKHADRLEQVLLIGLYNFLVFRFFSHENGNKSLINSLFLIDQFVLIIFLLVRRSTTEISKRPLDYVVALLGTILPLIIEPISGTPLIPAWACVSCFLAGSIIHVYAKLSLRRSFGVVPANRGIMHEGPYRFVRHPMYLGYIISQTAFIAAGPTLWNVTLLLLAWGFQIWRIENEEKILRLDERYKMLMSRVRYRLIPGIY